MLTQNERNQNIFRFSLFFFFFQHGYSETLTVVVALFLYDLFWISWALLGPLGSQCWQFDLWSLGASSAAGRALSKRSAQSAALMNLTPLRMASQNMSFVKHCFLSQKRIITNAWYPDIPVNEIFKMHMSAWPFEKRQLQRQASSHTRETNLIASTMNEFPQEEEKEEFENGVFLHTLSKSV